MKYETLEKIYNEVEKIPEAELLAEIDGQEYLVKRRGNGLVLYLGQGQLKGIPINEMSLKIDYLGSQFPVDEEGFVRPVTNKAMDVESFLRYRNSGEFVYLRKQLLE